MIVFHSNFNQTMTNGILYLADCLQSEVFLTAENFGHLGGCHSHPFGQFPLEDAFSPENTA